MKNFLETAGSLVEQGDRFIASSGPQEFFLKAHELLIGAKLHELFNFEELVEASFQNDFTTHQNYSSFQFSDLPMTVASGKECFLDLYFWRRRPTVIHDHHFTGAFQCLYGSNVDLEFEFTKERDIGAFHDLGQLNLKQKRKIVVGDIAPINLLEKFIHQNHHQADLTINACFRTPDIGPINLSNYLYSGLRFEKDTELINRGNRLQSFIGIGDFNLSKLNVNLDDAIHFMIRNYKSESTGCKFLEVKGFMERMIMQEIGVDISKLLDVHELKMDELESEYD